MRITFGGAAPVNTVFLPEHFLLDRPVFMAKSQIAAFAGFCPDQGLHFSLDQKIVVRLKGTLTPVSKRTLRGIYTVHFN